MKTLVAYYSLSGKNRKASEELARALSADVEEIRDLSDRGTGKMKDMGPGEGFRMMASALSTLLGQKTSIQTSGKNACEYDLVVLSSPVWMGCLPPAMRTYICQNKGKVKRAALLSVSGSGDRNKGFARKVEKALGVKLDDAVLLKEDDDNSREIAEYAVKLNL